MTSARALLAPAFLVATILLAAGCGNISITFDEDIDGSGLLVSETFEVADFTSIDISDSFDASITIGDETMVQVLADDNFIGELDIRVRNGQLKVGLVNGTSLSDGTLEATITLPRLDALEVSGSSSTQVYDLAGGSVSFDASGASDLVVRGVAEDVDVDASGSSDLTLLLEDVKTARVDLSGASSVDLRSAQVVMGSMSGASDLVIPADTQISALDSSGASSISRR